MPVAHHGTSFDVSVQLHGKDVQARIQAHPMVIPILKSVKSGDPTDLDKARTLMIGLESAVVLACLDPTRDEGEVDKLEEQLMIAREVVAWIELASGEAKIIIS